MMKTDREFLDGIYEKAKFVEVVETQTSNKNYFKPLTSVAGIAIILLSSIMFANYISFNYKMVDNSETNQVRAYIYDEEIDFNSLLKQSDYVVSGVVTGISKTYDSSSASPYKVVRVKIEDSVCGNFDYKTVYVKVPGGKSKSSFVPYQQSYEKGDKQIFFLSEDEKINNKNFCLVSSVDTVFTEQIKNEMKKEK